MVKLCPGDQCVFMNGCVHHNMKVASSTAQNFGISYFIFDDIASLAGSAKRQNVDLTILSEFARGLRMRTHTAATYNFLE